MVKLKKIKSRLGPINTYNDVIKSTGSVDTGFAWHFKNISYIGEYRNL